MNTHDIVIVGAGLIGSVLACALAQQTSLSIALLEAQPASVTWSLDHYHHRVSAIALSSQRIFQSLNVWDEIKKNRVSPFTQIHVWDEAGKGEIHFSSEEIAEFYLGYIIENNLMQAVLAEKIKQYPQIKVFSPVNLTAFQQTEKNIQLTTVDGNLFTAQLAVAADGANSWLREQAKIAVEKNPYGQEALVATVRTTLPHQQTARQVFTQRGPLAFLPLADANLSSIVWSTDEAKHLQDLAVNPFKTKLAQAFAYRLGEIQEVESRQVFPLYKQQAAQYVKPRLAMVGDAAHMLHPLAGQGANLGLLDAASLVDVIQDALKHSRDFASLPNLRRYERWRKADNVAMLMGVDLIKNLFESDKKITQQARTFGLNATQHLRWLKNIFTRHAVGNRQGLPLLATHSC